MAFLTKNHATARWNSLFYKGWNSSFIGGDQLIGLDIGSQAIKLVKMNLTKKGWQLQQFQVRFFSAAIGQKNVFDQEDQIVTLLKELLRETCSQEKKVATSIAGPSVIIKTFSVPTMTRHELEEHLEWEIDRYIPYDVQDIYWDYHLPHSRVAERLLHR